MIMGFHIHRFDGQTFGPFATEAIAKDTAPSLLRDWIQDTDRVCYWRTDKGLHAVVTSDGEDTDAQLVIVTV